MWKKETVQNKHLENWLSLSTTLEQVRLTGTGRHLKGENQNNNLAQERAHREDK